MKRFMLAAALLVASPAYAQVNGLWDAVIVSNGADIPFRYEIAVSGAQAQGFFFEGDRKVGSSSGTFADGTVKLDYEHLNTTLELTLRGSELAGTYRNNRAGARPQDVRMKRFTPVVIDGAGAPSLAGTWDSDAYPGVEAWGKA